MGEKMKSEQIIDEIVTNLNNNSLKREIGLTWEKEPWEKTPEPKSWGVWRTDHEVLKSDSKGEKYPLVIYSMIRWSGKKNPTPALWKTIEWRDKETNEHPSKLEAETLIKEIKNEVYNDLMSIDIPRSLKNYEIKKINRKGYSQSALICKLEDLADSFEILDYNDWEMIFSRAKFKEIFIDFSLWGADEIGDLLIDVQKNLI